MSRRREISDRISSLPDAILCHILSFLPTKQVVSTMVLSKRWERLWSSVPTIDFNDEGYFRHLPFKHFVYLIIASRDIMQPIKKFRLKIMHPSRCVPSDIKRWVESAVQRRVQHIDLNLVTRINLNLSILSCKTLVVLKLKGFTVKDLPCVDFPSLKILHLGWATFKNDEFLMNILSGCPILEDLMLINLNFPPGTHCTKGELKISLPKLVRADFCNLRIPFTLLYNVQFLRAGLEYSLNHKDFPTFHNLTHMELTIIPYKWHWHWLVEVLKHCPKLQNLVIDKDVKETYDEDWEHPQFVPECLSTQLRACTLKKYGGQECELQFARYIMENSRLLLTMTIRCHCLLVLQRKRQYTEKLYLCPRRSAACRLLVV